MPDAALAWIDRRLAAWAEHMARDAAGLGYPRQNYLHRLAVEGPTGAAIRREFGPRTMVTPDDVAATEAALVTLPEHLRAVLTAKYLGTGNDRQKARDLGIGYSAWRLRLSCGLHWLAGRLSR